MLFWALVVALLFLFLPGYLLARLAKISRFLSLGAAPAISCAMSGLTALILHFTPLPYNLGTFLISALLMLGLATLIARFSLPLFQVPPLSPVVLCLLPLVSAIGLLSFFVALPFAEAPAQNGDGLFHLNAVALMQDTGDAGPLGVLATMVNRHQPGYFYPSGWHSLVVLVASLLPTDLANNACLGVMVGPVLVAGFASLSHQLASRFTTRTGAVVLGISVLSQLGVFFPARIGIYFAIYPFAFTLALFPGVWALWLAAPGRQWWKHWSWIVILLAGVCGMVLAHPSMLIPFSLVVLGQGLAQLIVSTRKAELRFGSWFARGLPRDFRVLQGMWVVWICGIAVLLAFFFTPQVRGMSRFSREEGSRSQTLIDLASGTTWFSMINPWTVTFSILAVLGSIMAWRHVETLGVALGFPVFVGLTAFAAGPEGRLRALTGFWYKDPGRLAAIAFVFALAAVAVMAGFMSRLLEKLAHLWAQVGTLLWVAYLGVGILLIMPNLQRVYQEGLHPNQLTHNPWVTQSEYAFIRKNALKLPPGSTVIGDPDNGAGFFQLFNRNRAFLPFGNRSSMSEAQLYLADHFREIDSNPEVCRLINQEGIGYFYEDAPFHPNREYGHDFPGFYHVPSSSRLQLEATHRKARLWRIDCTPE